MGKGSWIRPLDGNNILSEMWKVNVSPLACAHLHSAPLKVLSFDQQPTVRDVLNQIGQDPTGIKVLFWGEKLMELDDEVENDALLHITNEAAERRRADKEAEDVKLHAAMHEAERRGMSSFDDDFVDLVHRTEQGLEP